ncbi:uncharacterized protein LOC110764618 [Prunus avium]|uniref:Uncharacterized protein LOC110764618 n=1 Tax=Prunus avium TaxID=42229 RepID=A0A6P5T813_PRUAV|nr:uncharacterized protein LOC110764618 [Prunus avium]
MARMEKNYWTMYFDGSSTEARSGAGVVIESPQGQRWKFAFQLDFKCTNNQDEYEALIIGLEILKEMKATRVLVYGDSQLVINQLTGEYQCTSENLIMYYVAALNTTDDFSRISFVHVPRAENHEANEMAQVASGVNILDNDHDRVVRIERCTLPALAERGMTTKVSSADITDEVNTAEADWRYPIVRYLRDPSGSHERTTRFRARCYLIYQNELYRKGSDGLLVLCPSAEDIKRVSIHPADEKPFETNAVQAWIYDDDVGWVVLTGHDAAWPFTGWAVDIIGKIYPAASNQHAWILVATDYFTKWVDAESYRSISSAQVVEFFKKHIVGIPETITADNGPVFASAETREYTEKMGIKLVHSTPYYPQSNGQAEASNKVIKGILEKMIEEKPRAWHDLLLEALWAYRVTKRSATGTSPYALTYGHDAIVPMELKVRSLRVTEQPGEERKGYAQAMA